MNPITIDSKSHPRLPFWNLSISPQVLYIESKADPSPLLAKLPEHGLTIVGTRTPLWQSKQLLKTLFKDLASSELVILSGFARGIDATAHHLAIQNNIPTLAFLGCGLDQNYPMQNAQLRQEILASGGALITEFPLGTAPKGWHFLKRNRLLALGSQAVLVIEASLPSGSLNTAQWGRELGRNIYAVPTFPGDLTYRGNQKILDRDHAEPFWGMHSLGSTWLSLAARKL